MLTKSNLHGMVNELRQENYYKFNCWCFTSVLIGFDDSIFWYDENEMEDILGGRCESISFEDLEFGDILIYRDDYGTLTHTAVYLGNGRVVHKPGSWPIEYTGVHKLLRDIPSYGHLAECARPIMYQQMSLDL